MSAEAGLDPTDIPPEVAKRLRDVEDALAHYSLDVDNLQGAIEALQLLLGTDKACLYGLRPRDQEDDLVIARTAAVGFPKPNWIAEFDGFLFGRGVKWGSYNAIRPEIAQRNRALCSIDLDRLTRGVNEAVERDLYGRLGFAGQRTLRALVCDGPSLLAWVGVVQPEPTTALQQHLLQRLVPAFQRRLVFERLVGQSLLAQSALEAVFDDIPGAAWVLDGSGNVAHANAAARARLDGEASATRTALRSCARGKHDPARLQVTPLNGGGIARGHVVVEPTAPQTDGPRAIDSAVARFRLTPAQTRVLERVVRGKPNATIAAELGIAERTVEAHLTAILEKAQVGSRAALIVEVFNGSR
ncbi:Transcriptional regulator, LuxR family [Labilithrix luteola]|uniref:Transcriptional regulator, LuxR family n=1 Tax=Labilithrix luteola TaxID=1391654 RepID=A0A0K1Q891_9BACT|nr:LuxR C-terminal-related transcriptional regulator [Labilithrix luteola]AKV01958.1 Transcriptional regulator, LuxR family [Labilithrix luteola]